MGTTRRTFLTAAPAIVAAAALPTPAPAVPLRPVFRRVGDEWRRVRMFELRPGDLFRLGDPAEEPDLAMQVNRVVGSPTRDKNGVWRIDGTHVFGPVIRGVPA